MLFLGLVLHIKIISVSFRRITQGWSRTLLWTLDPLAQCAVLGGAAREELSPRSWQCPWKVREYLHQGELWPSSAVCFLTDRSKICLPGDNKGKSLSSRGKGVNEWGNSRFSFHICFLLALWSGQIPQPPGPVSHLWNEVSAYKIQASAQYWSLICCCLLLD